MIIERGTRPERNFTIVGNEVLRDSRLSFRARGVLACILSYPENFQVSAERLSEVATEGRDAIRKAFSELELVGYLVREKSQGPDGRWSTKSVIYDTPRNASEHPETKPTTENPIPVADSLENRRLENRRLENRMSVNPSLIKDCKEDCKEDVLPIGNTKSRRIKHSDDDLLAAEWIFQLVCKVVPSAKQPNLPSWANDIRLMRECDGRSHKEICALFKWASQDSFWSSNILSPSKLRDKWTQLSARAAAPQKSSGKFDPVAYNHNKNASAELFTFDGEVTRVDE